MEMKSIVISRPNYHNSVLKYDPFEVIFWQILSVTINVTMSPVYVYLLLMHRLSIIRILRNREHVFSESKNLMLHQNTSILLVDASDIQRSVNRTILRNHIKEIFTHGLSATVNGNLMTSHKITDISFMNQSQPVVTYRPMRKTNSIPLNDVMG